MLASDTTDPFPRRGEQFAEQYRIVDLVGTGGFSRVYSARQGQLDRLVAVKILTPKTGSSRSSQEIVEKRFYREARLLSRLTGPNTVTVYDYGRTADGLLFMVSELIDGRNLKRLLEEDGALSESRTLRILTQILLGLSEVHSHGFLHRDIKPSNVMVFDDFGERDRAKLLDFGIAKGVTIGASDDTALTLAGVVIGTPGYMSPEQALGRPVSRASDVFSAGLIAYEMLTGQSPYRGLSMVQLQRRLLSSPLVIPGTVRVSDDVRTVLQRMLAIDVAERYETAAEALEDLGVHTAGLPRSDRDDDASNTPRPPNLLTFPMQLDRSGSTIIDTLADGSLHDTTTLLPRPADTMEERETEEQHPQVRTDLEPDATTVEAKEKRTEAPSGATAARPVHASPQRRYGLIFVVFAALVTAVILLFVLLGGEDAVETPSSSVTPPTAGSVDPTATYRAASEIVGRASRNAELDAQIAAKERLLDEQEQVIEPEPLEPEAFEPEQAEPAFEEPTPSNAPDEPAERPPRKAPTGSPVADDGPAEPKENERPAPADDFDFSVTPLDELE